VQVILFKHLLGYGGDFGALSADFHSPTTGGIFIISIH
jgi:hypothetical protein